MISDRSDEENYLIEEVFGFQMGIDVAVTLPIEIRRATLPSFTSSHCNINRLSKKEDAEPTSTSSNIKMIH